MAPIRRSKKPPPEGWELIEPTIEELNRKMREAEADPHEGKRKVEAEWPIFRIHHKRSRFIYDLYYKRKAISKRWAYKRKKNPVRCYSLDKYVKFQILLLIE
ncbi:unnamed protein product [Heterobilharzia americana]|nr:unnamed protein product [Heterobilharzia americana]